MLWPRELFWGTFVQMPAVMTGTRESQVWIGSSVPATGEETGGVLGIVQQDKATVNCPVSQAFSVWGDKMIAPISMLSVKVACIETGVWKHWNRIWC